MNLFENLFGKSEREKEELRTYNFPENIKKRNLEKLKEEERKQWEWQSVNEYPDWIDLAKAEDQIPIGKSKIVYGHHFKYKIVHTIRGDRHGVEIVGKKRIN